MCLTGSLILLLLVQTAQASEAYLQRADVRDYIHEISDTYDLNQHRIAGLFARLKPLPTVLEAISRPAEKTLTWRDYRPIFLKPDRIEAGQLFMQEHRSLLTEAEEQYGVPAEIITAIIGVETFYGRITGRHRVLESLATLAFDYPPRSAFFKRELTEFLVLSQRERWQAGERFGSYAGAMGLPQFIASSYRQYAVDFDNDGQRDLFTSVADAIGSVANYLAVHGWQRQRPVAEAWPEAAGSRQVLALETEGLRPDRSLGVVRDLGFQPNDTGERLAPDAPVGLLVLQGVSGEEAWVGFQNLFVIMRYNHSHLYAMAVHQLADSLTGANP